MAAGKIEVILVKIDGVFCSRVFFVKNAAIRYAMRVSGDRPWEAILFSEGEILAAGTGMDQISRSRCKMLF